TYEVDQVLISFKNISKYELNISEDELMERFKRGDESRSSQGSGLGLSITKSLIENQNGDFKISIDGDLFKSMIYLPRSEKSDSTNSSQE
ncbi:MAG: GHKL domain-containing protein, partial [Amphibacillus sp.]|nr:GHKL domain-containing protein [Amphibacillus sp.]